MKANLEDDLLKTDWIKHKCQHSDTYSQNLYAALCNNRFFKDTEEWTCTWRYAGGIVADLRGFGEDYMSFYCSSIGSENNKDYVWEGFVTSEINNDLFNLGWNIRPYSLKSDI